MNRETLIENIIKLELDMFLSLKATSGQECQERPHTFKVMRWMTHSVLSINTLESLLFDLREACRLGRNTMVEKYARMDNLIPPLKNDFTMINNICEYELEWLKETANKYPNVVKGANFELFKRYMSCELETYSDKTLNFLYDDILKANKEGKNLCKLRYSNLVKRMGYSSIDIAEEKFKNS